MTWSPRCESRVLRAGPAAVGRIIPGGDLHEKYCGWLDKVAAFMLSLRTDAGEYVPVLFRPFHEHTGNGFWWGKGNCTAEEYIALWRFTLEYLRDTKGVHNLLYVYSPDIVSSQDNYLEFWPGDAYVDVLGLDAYDRSSWAIETNGLRLMRLLKHIAYLKNKPFAFTETGLENNTSQSKWWTEKLSKAIAGIPVAYVLVWRNKDTNHFFGPYPGCVSEEDFKTFVAGEQILLEKEPVNTSEESDHDSIPEITYWHEDFEYGTEEDHLDRWVIPIDKAEFLAASANYKNIQPDSTVQLPTDQGSYSVSLENGHTKVLSDCYEQSDAYRKYLYKGYLAEMNCYVFEYEGLEWEGISYVSKANGEEYGLRTQALFSLNQNCYCVDACTELEGERAGIIKVFQVSGGEFKFMFGLWSDKIFPQTVCWKDNITLYVKALREENGADQTYYYKIPLDQVQ